MFTTKTFYKEVRVDIFSRIHHKKIFLTSFFFLFSTFISTSLHYSNVYYGNNFTWIFWLTSLILLFSSFVSPAFSFKKYTNKIDVKMLAILLIITFVYWISHLWNFNSAPWNIYGLFDDAAWDIYFASDKIFADVPFQAAFFDQVGYISRETIFHYYITIFFELFGYNLLTFNFSLLILGYTTVLFTSLIVQKLFKNLTITLLMGLVINFLPLHYMHIFMGHRYAIAAPLMTISLYFLYSAFLDNSVIKSSLSALFAALCWGSAIMGKQYILGLALTVVVILIFNRKVIKSKKNITIALFWIIAFIFTATPLIQYILYNPDAYFGRERSLLGPIIVLLKDGGVLALKPYYTQVKDLFFQEVNFRRQFLHDYPILPIAYYFLLIPGLVLAFIKKRFEILILSLIPVLTIFLSGAYDFRVLIAAPVWIIAMAFSLHFVAEMKPGARRQSLKSILFVLIFIGIIPSTMHIFNVSKNPNYIYLLPHKDVAVSRMMQDIVVGDISPSIEIKHNEFSRGTPLEISHDTLACPQSAYAIAHLYMQDYDDKKILSLCNQGIQLLKTPSEILQDNYVAILGHTNTGKDLKLVWETSDKSREAISIFRKYNKYGSETIYKEEIDGNSFALYVLTIEAENLNIFKEELSKDRHET